MSDISIRPATLQDCGLMFALLRELAEFEKLLDDFSTSEEAIARDFFGPRPAAFCDLAFEGDEAVGLATYYFTYGSFTARRGVFVEDLFVRPAFRGRGIGQKLLAHLALQGALQGASRLHWLVLDWNRPALDFYKSLGAEPAKDWLMYRLEGDALERLARR